MQCPIVNHVCFDHIGRDRRMVKESLETGAAFVGKKLLLGFGFDSLSKDRQPECACERDDSSRDCRIVLVGHDMIHERLVDLELIER